jgi:predicted PurR-regulated permease PerM
MTPREHVRYWLIGVVIAGLAIYLLRDILLPFVIGAAVAYFLDPLADRLQRRGMSRGLATSLITLVFVLLLLAMMLLLIPLATTQLLNFLDRLPRYFEKLQELIGPYLADLMEEVPELDAGKIKDALGAAGSMAGVLAQILKKVMEGGMVVVDILSILFITPFVTFYLLRDWDSILARIDAWLPRPQAPVIRQLAREVDEVLAAFIRGQGTVCLAMAVFYAVGLAIVRLDFGILVGFGAGIVTFIPYLGPIVGVGVALLIGAVQFLPNVWPLVGIIVVFVLGQILESYVLTPKLVGDKVGLHPLWVIFGLMAGGSLFGFLGMLLALPVAAVIGVLVRYGLERYAESRLYHGPDG